MSWINAQVAFAKHFANYEPRPSQDRLAEHAEATLLRGGLLLAEGPTGVGKSFAALVPAIDHARRKRKPVIASTATKALQDQYIGDCQTLQRIYAPDLRFVVLKGRSNYVCRAKVDEIRKGEQPFAMDLDKVMEAAEVANGDLDRLGFTVPDRERARLSVSSDECPGKSNCPFAATCFTERVKTEAKDAHVVIANHALVAIDTTLRAQNVNLLPDHSALVIDEAHEFESYVSGALSTKVTERSLTVLGNQVAEFTGNRDLTGLANVAAKALFDRLRTVFANRERKEANTQAITPQLLLQLQDELGGVLQVVGQLDAALHLIETSSDRDVLKRKRLSRRVDTLNEKVRTLVLGEFGEWVRWVEMERRGSGEIFSLQQAPLEVAPFLATSLWPHTPAVLVSATLSEGGDFRYLAGRLGFPPEHDTFACPSPFDYANQALAYIPRGPVDSIATTAELIRAADGRAMVLFTSWETLNATYRALAPVLAQLGHTLLKQGDAPPRALAQQFKDDEHSVLLATRTFFTGVDIRGDSLRLLVINKLLFRVPDVLFSAQCKALDDQFGKWHEKGSFKSRQVPEMVMTLMQGMGRLIRSATDHGLVAVLDERVYTKPIYGNRVRAAIGRSFPKLPLTNDLDAAVSYLRALDAEQVPV